MEDIDIGYVMGVVVAAGSFTGDKLQPSLAIRLHDDDPRPLLRMQHLLGGNLNGPYSNVGSDGRTRSYYTWQLRGAALRRWLPLFRTYLPESRKRDQFDAWCVKYADYLSKPL